jgi:hypothetical protein
VSLTSIGFTPGLAMTPTPTRSVPLVPRPQEEAEASTARAVPLRRPPSAPTGWVRVGTVQLGPAVGYLLAWAAVLFAVFLSVLVVGYLMLYALGVVASVSKALAIVLGEPLPDSGVLPLLQPQSMLPLMVMASFVLSALAFAAGFAAALVHNAVSSLSGGLLVRLRPSGSAPVTARGRHAAPSARVDLRRSNDS